MSDSQDVQRAFAPLIGKVLAAAFVIPAEDEVGGDCWHLRLRADDGTELVLATQDSDGYQSWLRVIA